MSNFCINRAMFEDLTYDEENDNNSAAKRTVELVPVPTVFVVFANSDINVVISHLIRSFENPFNSEAVATIVVQESVKEDFIEKLQVELQLFKPYGKDILEHAKMHNFKKALETAKELNARIITLENLKEDSLGPTLVCDFNHEQLGFVAPSGVLTLHTFRTAREAVKLVNDESIKFSNVSVWSENHTPAYEVIAALKSPYNYINCMRNYFITFQHIDGKENYVFMDECYHYETLNHKGVKKIIVFPVGSKFDY